MIPFALMFVVMAGQDDCRVVDGPYIRAEDVGALVPSIAAVPRSAVFGFSPNPGVRRTVEPGEISRFARSYGIDDAISGPICFTRAAAPLSVEAVIAAMRKSMAAERTHIEILELSRFPVPNGTVVFPRETLLEPATGTASVWNGHVQYDGGTFPIWAKARITVVSQRVVAARSLKAGHIITNSDLLQDTVEEFPRRIQPIASMDAALGRVTRRMIPAGTPIAASALGEANAVERGQIIAVEVRSGAAVLKFEAKAEGAGRKGDTIPLRNLQTGKLFRAQVEENGRAVLQCAPPRSFE